MFYPFASTLNNEIMTVSFNERLRRWMRRYKTSLSLIHADIEEMQNREKQNLGKIEDLQD